jgi:DNA-binding Lrp family transcriptional regulator
MGGFLSLLQVDGHRFALDNSHHIARYESILSEPEAKTINLDDTDQRLLAALKRDGRAALSDLAAQLGVSRATIRARMDRMQTQGVIRGFTVQTAQDVVTAPVRGLMMLAISGPGAERIMQRLTGHPAVRSVHSTNGKWDLIVELGTDTLEDLDRVLFDLRRMPGVETSETSLLLNTRKGARRR